MLINKTCSIENTANAIKNKPSNPRPKARESIRRFSSDSVILQLLELHLIISSVSNVSILQGNQFRLVQTCSDLFKPVQTCPSLFRLVQTCSNLSKPVQTCLNILRLVTTCSNLSKHVKTCPNVYSVPIVSNVSIQSNESIVSSFSSLQSFNLKKCADCIKCQNMLRLV